MRKKKSRKAGVCGVSGKLLTAKSAAGIASMHVEVWDAGLAGQDIIGWSTTDETGAFHIALPEVHMKRLGLPERPDIFFKIFDRSQLVFSGESADPLSLKRGTNRVTLSIDYEPPLAPDELLKVTVIHPAPVLDGPKGAQICELQIGDVASVLRIGANGCEVRLPNGQTGWIDIDYLDPLTGVIRDYWESGRALPVFPEKAHRTLQSVSAEFPTDTGLGCLLVGLDVLGELSRYAGGSNYAEPVAMVRFDAALDMLIEQVRPPQRPNNFTLLALRHEIDGAIGGLDIPGLGRSFRLPCLLDLRRLHLIGSAIFRSAWRRAPFDPAAINDRVWAGLFVLGRLVTEANFAGALYRQIELGEEIFAASFLKSGRCGGFSALSSWSPANGKAGASFPQWAPGRFPGMGALPRFDCRIEQWGETERALRCCREVYRIDGFSGSLCSGGELTIHGAGFGASRFWPFEHGPREPGGGDPPPLSGPPGPFESVVFFPALDGGSVRATEYREWSDTRVVVVIPDTAVSGVVEMRIVCGNDLEYCGVESKLPNHDPRDAYLDQPRGIVEIDVRRRTDGLIFDSLALPSLDDERPFDVTVGGCTDVELLISGRNLKELTFTLRQEGIAPTPLPFPRGARSVTRDIPPTPFSPISLRVPSSSGVTQRIDVEAVDGCDNMLSRTITLYRTPKVWVTSVPGPVNPLIESSVPVTVELSCHPDTFPGSVAEIPVNIITASRLIPDADFLNFRDTGPMSTQLGVPSPFVGQGLTEVVGRVLEPSGSLLRHEQGSAGFVVATPAFTGVFTGAGALAFTPSPGMMLPSDVPASSFASPLTARVAFSAFGDETAPTSRVTLLSFDADFGSIGVNLAGGGIGTYNCVDFSLSVPVSLDISVFTETVTLSLTFTTGSTSTGLVFGTGSPIGASGSVTLVASAVVSGAARSLERLNGLHALVTLTGGFAPAP